MLIRIAPVLPLLFLLLTPLGWEVEERLSIASRESPFVLARRCLDWPPSQRQVTCGRLYVPERRGVAGPGRVISMPFVVMRAPPAGREPDPVFFIDGGPGGQSWAQARPGDDWNWVFEHFFFLRGRDFVMLNQRGVGPRTEPPLDCPEFIETLPDILDHQGAMKAARACHERLTAAGIPLGAYNTTAIADDHIALRRVLGYGRYNIWGPSYGSRVAQVMMRRDTEAIRAVVMEGTYPLDAPDDWEWERYFAEALERVFTACDADSTCHARFGDLRPRFAAAIQGLEANPEEFEAYFPYVERWEKVTVNHVVFTEMLSDALYGEDWLARLPLMLERMESPEGRRGEVQDLLENYLNGLPGSLDGMGMAWSVDCAERGRVPGKDEVEAWAGRYPALADWIRWRNEVDACTVWPVEAEQPLDRRPVKAAIPVLVLGGRFDFTTPPGWSLRVANELPHAALEILPIGHFVSNSACARRMMAAFLAAPGEKLDRSCAVNHPPLPLGG